MTDWLLGGGLALAVLCSLILLFFFATTRGALLVRALSSEPPGAADHVYPIYSNMFLIRLVDHQPVIAAILLFQYRHLVRMITEVLESLDLTGKRILITSCAFGNVIPQVVASSLDSGAEKIRVVDLINNELEHARSKLNEFAGKVEMVQGDATDLGQENASVAVNVMFFLLHELPDQMKSKALDEAGRVLEPGGKLFIAEFHRPDSWILRVLSWTYFKVFEPYGLALWDCEDPLSHLQAQGNWSCERTTCLCGNFQVITATKLG